MYKRRQRPLCEAARLVVQRREPILAKIAYCQRPSRCRRRNVKPPVPKKVISWRDQPRNSGRGEFAQNQDAAAPSDKPVTTENTSTRGRAGERQPQSREATPPWRIPAGAETRHQRG